MEDKAGTEDMVDYCYLSYIIKKYKQPYDKEKKIENQEENDYLDNIVAKYKGSESYDKYKIMKRYKEPVKHNSEPNTYLYRIVKKYEKLINGVKPKDEINNHYEIMEKLYDIDNDYEYSFALKHRKYDKIEEYNELKKGDMIKIFFKNKDVPVTGFVNEINDECIIIREFIMVFSFNAAEKIRSVLMDEIYKVLIKKDQTVDCKKYNMYKKYEYVYNFPVYLKDLNNNEKVINYCRDNYCRKRIMNREKYKDALKNGWIFEHQV